MRKMAIKVIVWSIIGLFITGWMSFSVENIETTPKTKEIKTDSIDPDDVLLMYLPIFA